MSKPSAGPVRLVAIDLDGTLLTDSKRVSSQTVEALRCLPDRHVRVVIASARPPRSVRHIYRSLGLTTWQINYNGALIWDEPAGQVVFHQPMPGLLVKRVIDLARQFCPDLIVSCEILDRWYTDRVEPRYLTETARLFPPDVICDVDTMCRQDITKLMFMGEQPMLQRLEVVVGLHFDAEVRTVCTDRDLLQVMDHRVGKGFALQRVADHYGVPMAQVMAIGDAPNDVGMLRLAGVGVAMDNAHPITKSAADWVAPSNNDHGVLAALQRWGLC